MMSLLPIKAIPLTSLDTSQLQNVYVPINPGGLDTACFMLKFINNSSIDVLISYDGVVDHDFLPGATTAKIQTPYIDEALFKKGLVVWVMAASSPTLPTIRVDLNAPLRPGSDNLYLAGYYQGAK